MAKPERRHSYQRVLDPNRGDSIAKVARLVAPGSRVLDVGCGPGVLGAYLVAEKGCTVDGIEINKADALVARASHRKVAVIDLETADPKHVLEGERYDYVVCADVLEHLRDPGRAVQRLRPLLAPAGRFLLSIPNIAYSGLIAALIEGEFRYTVEGLLDSTHLRFFTRASLLEWLPTQGLKPISIDTVDVPLERSEFAPFKLDGYPPALLSALLSRPDAITYQFIIEAIPTDQRLATLDSKQFAAPSRPASMGFFVQAYLGLAGKGLSEADSVRAPGRIAVDRQRLRLEIPVQREPLERVRLDISDRPGLVRLFDLVIHDAQGETLWKWDGTPSLVDRGSELEIVGVEQGGGLQLLCAEDAQIDLPLDDETLVRLRGGGTLTVELSWPASPDGFAIAQRYFGPDEQLRRIRELTAQLRSTSVKIADLEAEHRRTLAEKKRLTSLHAYRLKREAELEAQLAQTKNHIDALEAKLAELNAALDGMRNELTLAHGSTSWKVTRPFRTARDVAVDARRQVEQALRTFRHQGVRGWLRRRSYPAVGTPAAVVANDLSYQRWTRLYDTIDDAKRAEMRAALETMPKKPLISVVVPTYNTPEKFLREMIESVRAQAYPNWELCIADDASPNARVREILSEYAARDSRIRVVFRETNGHISEASNSALAIAKGEYIALLDHDDLIPEHALFVVARYINQHPEGRLFYSDEDKLTPEGERSDPYFKSDWNRELILAQNMFSHLGIYQAELLREVGGFRKGFEGSQDHDLLLRCVEKAGNGAVVHIPHVLYHWRIVPGSTSSALSEKPYALTATLRAIQEHLERTETPGVVAPAIKGTNMMRVRYLLPESPPLVSIIIPCRDRAELTRTCVDSIVTKTVYPNYEIIIVDNGSVEAATLSLFEELSVRKNVRILHDDRPFNFAALNNAAAREAKGEILCLLNNDIEVISPDWLGEMVSHAVRPGNGCVGAALWYPTDILQHGGVLLGIGDLAGHFHHEMPRGHYGHFGRAVLTQNLSAVTAACLAVKKSIWEEVGGINEDLAVAFNDVDFCLRVRKAGYENVYAPNAELYHHESASRGSDHAAGSDTRARFMREVETMKRLWGSAVEVDPYYNPNLALGMGPVFAPAFPPRIGMLD